MDRHAKVRGPLVYGVGELALADDLGLVDGYDVGGLLADADAPDAVGIALHADRDGGGSVDGQDAAPVGLAGPLEGDDLPLGGLGASCLLDGAELLIERCPEGEAGCWGQRGGIGDVEAVAFVCGDSSVRYFPLV